MRDSASSKSMSSVRDCSGKLVSPTWISRPSWFAEDDTVTWHRLDYDVEAGFDTGLTHRGIDPVSATMHHDRPHPYRFHKENIHQDVMQRFLVVQNAATQFDDGRFVAKRAYPTQSFDQSIGFFDGVLHVLG